MLNKANKDWKDLLKEYNIDEDWLNKTIESDEFKKKVGIVKHDNNQNYILDNSQIQGKGVFATKNIKKNNIIGDAYRNNLRTYLGRYTNHSPEYNAKFLYTENSSDIITIAYKDIEKGEEILVDYRNHTFNKEYYNKNLL